MINHCHICYWIYLKSVFRAIEENNISFFENLVQICIDNGYFREHIPKTQFGSDFGIVSRRIHNEKNIDNETEFSLLGIASVLNRGKIVDILLHNFQFECFDFMCYCQPENKSKNYPFCSRLYRPCMARVKPLPSFFTFN